MREFEETFAAYVGRKHAIMVNSGSSADLLVAFGLGHGNGEEEILVPAVTWPTQVWSCLMAGYNVRLVDVDPATLQMSIEDAERKFSPHTEALFLAHILDYYVCHDATPAPQMGHQFRHGSCRVEQI